MKMKMEDYLMNRDQALIKYNEIDKRVGVKPFWEVRDIIENAYNELESIKKENIRLKKQLSKNHHIECSCSFCKPVACSYVDNNFTFTSCDDCKNKIDGTYQEVCSNCKRFYGCYFEAKEV